LDALASVEPPALVLALAARDLARVGRLSKRIDVVRLIHVGKVIEHILKEAK
jgi:hypothetical protein